MDKGGACKVRSFPDPEENHSPPCIRAANLYTTSTLLCLKSVQHTTILQVMPPAPFDAPLPSPEMETPGYHRDNNNNKSYGSALAVGGNGFMSPPLFPNHVHTPAATRFRNMIINTDKLIVCPGVYDGLSARLAHEVGFEALYMVSLSSINMCLARKRTLTAFVPDRSGHKCLSSWTARPWNRSTG